MKVVILAGGMGTRLAEETEVRPKPMVEIGGKPMLWHIMKLFGHQGLNEFVVALGYKSEFIKRYFLERSQLSGSMTLELKTGAVTRHDGAIEDWLLHLVETGQDSNTGGRVKRLQSLIGNETFMVTYGDGLADIDLKALLAFHKSHGRMATVTAVRPPARFGGIIFDGDLVSAFTEKPQTGEGWINGGFMVLEPKIFDAIAGDASSLESEVLEQLAKERQLAAYRHDHFWQCMDTIRDRTFLQGLWSANKAPWKVWP